MIFKTFEKIINTTKVLGCIAEDIQDNPSFATLVAALAKLVQRKLTKRQSMVVARWRKFVKAAAKVKDAVPVIISEQGKAPPSDISDDSEKNPWAYWRASSRSSRDWYEERLQRVRKGDNYHTKQEYHESTGKTQEVDSLIVLKSVDDLLTDVVDQRRCRLIEKSGAGVPRWCRPELSRMTKKITVQMKDKTFWQNGPGIGHHLLTGLQNCIWRL